jgi:hypothetical protein
MNVQKHNHLHMKIIIEQHPPTHLDASLWKYFLKRTAPTSRVKNKQLKTRVKNAVHFHTKHNTKSNRNSAIQLKTTMFLTNSYSTYPRPHKRKKKSLTYPATNQPTPATYQPHPSISITPKKPRERYPLPSIYLYAHARFSLTNHMPIIFFTISLHPSKNPSK